MRRLEAANFGPIRQADVEFGDLTVLVGPQASGKSLFVQLAKAITDAGAIRNDLKNHGFEWLHGNNLVSDYCSLYFGGGLQDLLGSDCRVRSDGHSVLGKQLAKPGGRARAEESMFLIPAQRVLVLQDGWPKHFRAYTLGDPYAMRRFSESLRLLMENGVASGDTLFPQERRLMAPLRRAIDRAIYVGFKLMSQTEGLRKQIVLSADGGTSSLPFNAWSAGQREFTPLLLSMYWLLPPSSTARRESLADVIIEEPEMGLHPQAILGFLLLVLALLHREYRVIISSHSPVVLDLVWALSRLRETTRRRAVRALREIFDIPAGDNQVNPALGAALGKSLKVYYFDRESEGVIVRDISNLEPDSADEATAGWGGLSGFSGKIAEIVGETLSRTTRQ
jgi:hypothetical protein